MTDLEVTLRDNSQKDKEVDLAVSTKVFKSKVKEIEVPAAPNLILWETKRIEETAKEKVAMNVTRKETTHDLDIEVGKKEGGQNQEIGGRGDQEIGEIVEDEITYIISKITCIFDWKFQEF